MFGYLRETNEDAVKAGKDLSTGIERTGLDIYLKVIFPDVDDWIHDEPIGLLFNDKICRRRPDYRSDKLKLIIEYDGIQHFTSPAQIKRDKETTDIYTSLGYEVIRIPYFIQLTNAAAYKLFGRKIKEPLFDVNYPSLSIENKNTPAFLCLAGINLMAEYFIKFPDQYEVNVKYLEKLDSYLTEVNYLKNCYNIIQLLKKYDISSN